MYKVQQYRAEKFATVSPITAIPLNIVTRLQSYKNQTYNTN